MNKRLRELRKELNLTQKEVAKAIGITVSAYSNYEQGLREPPYAILVNLCKFFKVTSDYLLGIENF